MITRIILLVIDGFGIGALPDAVDYGDAEANTLVHLAEMVDGLSVPNFEILGLGHIAQIKGVRTMAQPSGSFGRLGFASPGKDSTVGCWEISGVIQKDAQTICSFGVPAKIVDIVEQILGRKAIGKNVSTMGVMLRQHSMEHMATGAPILWTDGGNTCCLAMHESAMAPLEFQQRCREIRKATKDAGSFIRVVAQPVIGGHDLLRPHVGRKDFVMEPPGLTMFDVLSRSGQMAMGVGKIYDLFTGRGFTKAFPVASGLAALDEVIAILSKMPRGLVCASLDLLSEDAAQAATALQDFDRRLPDLFEKLRLGDMVIITGDHGRDFSLHGQTSTREYVPVFVTGPKLAQGVDLGNRPTAADVGQTIVEALRTERILVGDSFLDALRPG
ncbi:MAG: phosphopentomutase [Nitrospira sp.]|nr:phosphopentomutase [Nitrospira sp.]MDH4368363.1 phosphopentomutase [Nitrospira sp.]MDH5496224.1 phosphopentomutase [Nitrospira sp.]MDH5726498.1 phosphopentomutase [Nitrospira sp.]